MPFRYKARVGAVDLQGRLLCGVASGSVAALISCPAEVTLVRLSNDGALPEAQRRNYKGVAGACCVLCTAGVSHVQCPVSCVLCPVSLGSCLRSNQPTPPPHTLPLPLQTPSRAFCPRRASPPSSAARAPS